MNDQKTVRSLIKGLLFLLPAVAIITLFTISPMIQTIDMSTYTSYNYFSHLVYAKGIDNFSYIFHDEEFFLALKNTLVYVLGVMPISICLSLLIAILLNSQKHIKRLCQTIYFLPFVTSTLAISFVWQWIFHSDYGLLNDFLRWIGLRPVKWLLEPKWAMVSLIVLGVWKSLGYNIIIFLAGLQNIDEQYNRAARIDGASPWQRTRMIVLPLLSPSIFFITIVTLIDSFKVFDQVYALYGKTPGPRSSCLTIVYYIYEKFYNQFSYGIASAAVVVLYVIILLLNGLQFWGSKKWVHY